LTRADNTLAASTSRVGGLLSSPGKSPMPKMRRKSDLPTKICAVCRRSFAWRRKWTRDWPDVKFCS